MSEEGWSKKLRFQVAVIAALLFVIWVVVQTPAQWR